MTKYKLTLHNWKTEKRSNTIQFNPPFSSGDWPVATHPEQVGQGKWFATATRSQRRDDLSTVRHADRPWIRGPPPPPLPATQERGPVRFCDSWPRRDHGGSAASLLFPSSHAPLFSFLFATHASASGYFWLESVPAPGGFFHLASRASNPLRIHPVGASEGDLIWPRARFDLLCCAGRQPLEASLLRRRPRHFPSTCVLFCQCFFRGLCFVPPVLLCSPQLNWDQCRLSASCEGRGLGGFSQAARRAAAAPWLDFSDIPWFPFVIYAVSFREFTGFLWFPCS
jgi:hypothetical protein